MVVSWSVIIIDGNKTGNMQKGVSFAPVLEEVIVDNVQLRC